MNVNKPSMRLRDVGSSQPAATRMMGHLVPVSAEIRGTDTQSPQSRRHPHHWYLNHAERSHPNEVSGVVDTLSKPTAKEAELLRGNGRDQEAKAVSRKAMGMHNQTDRVIPAPKGG